MEDLYRSAHLGEFPFIACRRLVLLERVNRFVALEDSVALPIERYLVDEGVLPREERNLLGLRSLILSLALTVVAILLVLVAGLD